MASTLTHPKRLTLPTPLVIAGMALGMVLIYRTVSLPLIVVGLAIFGLLALLRPEIGLLFVPLAAPWYLAPVYIPDIRASGFVLPLHEMLLLVTFAATAARFLLEKLFRIQHAARSTQHAARSAFAPHALFLVAGIIGVAIAVERGPALRDLRWMIVEPLMFYALLRWQIGAHGPWYARQAAWALVVSGTFVALLGLLQFAGIDLVPVLLSPTKSFSDSVVQAEGVSRVASVYGHPNNLGMYLGRVWPVAVALAFVRRRAKDEGPGPDYRQQTTGNGRWPTVAAFCALICLGGLAVSFSRGAWLGASIALAVLALGWVRGQQSKAQALLGRRAVIAGVVLAFLALVALAVAARGDILGGSTTPRLLIWRESLQLVAQHPFGLGLDQFYYYHNPEFGRSLIDPSLVGTSEQYAKHPHNLLLELWLLLGPLGLAAFAWLLTRFVRQAVGLVRQVPPQAHTALALGALAAMLAAVTHGLVDTFYFWPDIALTFWLLLALVEAHPPAETGPAASRPLA